MPGGGERRARCEHAPSVSGCAGCWSTAKARPGRSQHTTRSYQSTTRSKPPPFSPPSGGPVTHSVAAQLQLRPPSSTLPASVSCVQHVLGVTCRPTAFAAGILPAKEMTIAELKRWSNLSNLPARHLFGAQFTGQPVLIGGTMGTCSYVLTGTEKVKTF